MRRRRLGAVILVGTATVTLGACKARYRVGEKVWVEWDEKDYPAFIVEARSATRYRVHFDGYESRWDQDVGIDRIKGRITGPVRNVPPPPEKVARSLGLKPKASPSASPVALYKPGDRLRVRWRGSVYTVSVLEVRSADELLVHYEGFETAFDEVINRARIVGKR